MNKLSNYNYPIDIVLPWVDQNDPNWLKKYNQFQIKKNNDDAETRFRDYGTLKFLFRSIEKFAPWINRVYLITDHQTPNWLNKENKKLVLVNHDEYIEQSYLPTFDSNLIELSVTNIDTLSEHFICFNDDTFINKPVQPKDFFDKNGNPKDTLAFNAIMPMSIFDHTYINNLSILNQKYNKFERIRHLLPKLFNIRNGRWNLFSLLLLPWPRFTRFFDPHIPISFLKSTYADVIEQYPEIITETGFEHLRSEKDFSNWLIRYEQMLSGKFTPRYFKFGVQYRLDELDAAIQDLTSSKHHLININDSNHLTDTAFKIATDQLVDVFSEKFPDKSSFEV